MNKQYGVTIVYDVILCTEQLLEPVTKTEASRALPTRICASRPSSLSR